MIKFYKYQGTGNDFVMIDNRDQVFDNQNLDLVRKMCDRRFGIGADGLILIEESDKADFYVNYFNADGSKSFCGNGARCSVAFANFLGMIQNETEFDAIDGLHIATIEKDLVYLKMGDVNGIEKGQDYLFCHTGSPHYMRFVEDLKDWDIYEFGKSIRYSDPYKKEGTNVNLIQEVDEVLHLRTYERGVENETYSCGTGATAVALAYMYLKGLDQATIPVEVKGGSLQVKAQKKGVGFENIWLIGPGEQVFEGVWKTI
ncbi:MAG: diaminopimelate epimerase [Crocinitomicaceae bacterium]